MEGKKQTQGGKGRFGGTRGKSFAGHKGAEDALNINSQVHEEYRPHLLNILKKFREQKRFIKRVLYIANILDSDARQGDVEKIMAEYFKEFVNQEAGQEITGLCLVLGTYCLHFLEGDNDIVMNVLEDLKNQVKKHGSIYYDIAIVSFMEDCPERLFKCWIVKNLNVPASGGGVEIPQRTAFDKGSSLYQSFIQISDTVNKSYQKSLTAVSTTLKAQASEFLPPLEELADFFTDKKFMSIHEFSETFLEMPDLVLESELQWPVIEKLTY